MDGRDERIYEEAAALWRELHGEASPTPADSATLLDMITGALPDLTYDRLNSPWLRTSTVTWPRPAREN